jgi:uncharacterized protein
MEEMEKIIKLTNLLASLNKSPEPVDFEEVDRGFLAGVSCREMALAQQNMMSSGVVASELWRMWCRNRQILPDQAAKLRAELPQNHILQKVLAEHEMTQCFVSDLDDVNNKIQELSYASSVTMEIRKLGHIAKHLTELHQHSEREEHVIFPELNRRGYAGLLRGLDEQHSQIMEQRRKLKELVWHVDKMNFDDFKNKLKNFVEFLVVSMRMHIFIETNIIFPLALEVISDKKVWDRMKDICDEIGYCCYDL